MDDDGGGSDDVDDEDDAYLDEKVAVHDRVPYPVGAVVEDASHGRAASYPYRWMVRPCV